jgi:hypothetical protein
MKDRPLPVTLVSYLFILAGAMGIIYHATELSEIQSRPEVIWVLLVRLFAIVGGVYALKGANWARWLLVLWITYHVVISFYHTTTEMATHLVFMILILLALFHKNANQYFTRSI